LAKVTGVKKINVEDFPSSSREVVGKLASVLNSFLTQVVTAITQQITYADNLKGKVYSVDLTAGTSTAKVAWTLNEKPTAIYLGNLTLADYSAPSSAYSLSSYFKDGQINMTFIGLSAGSAHKATVIAQV